MRPRHIEVFPAVMQAGTASRAAHLWHICRPAVPKVPQHAESLLGFALVERERGKVRPTPEALRRPVEVDRRHDDAVAICRLGASLRTGAAQAARRLVRFLGEAAEACLARA